MLGPFIVNVYNSLLGPMSVQQMSRIFAPDTFPGYSECICSRKQEFSGGNSKGFEMREISPYGN